MENDKKGFTLIELLVVISIIGVLSVIVFASLNVARSKGNDASVKSNLASIKPQAEVLYDSYGGYGVDSSPTAFVLGTCANTADTLFYNENIWGQISNAAAASGGLTSCMSTSVAPGSWAVAVQLKQNSTTEAWCVDSSGFTKKLTLDGSPTQEELNALITNDTIAKCD